MAWEVKERQRYALIEQDSENPRRHKGIFSIGPSHVRHHSTKEFVEFAYVENPDFASEANCRVFAQSSNIAIEVYDFYNKLFDPDYENVSVYDERFDVQYLFKEPDTWRSVDYYNPRIEVIPLEDGVDIKKVFDTDYGTETLEITYTIRTGARLKPTIVFTNKTAEQRTFRVVMKFSGITSDKVKQGQVEDLITEEKHVIAPVMFFGEDNQHLKLSEYLWRLGETDEETGEWSPTTLKDIVLDVQAQGCKADIIIGNYTLGENESLLVDPDSDTFYVGHGYDDAYEYGISSFALSEDYIAVYSYSVIVNPAYRRGGFRFPNVAIPQGSNVTAAKFSGYVYDSTTYDDINTEIYGNDVDDALDFNDLQEILDTGERPRTTASVSWVATLNKGTWNHKTGLEDIVHEIVNRALWSSNNALVLLFIPNTDRTESCLFHSYDKSSAEAAYLEVTWEAAAPPQTIEPSPVQVSSSIQAPSIALGAQVITPSPVAASSIVQTPSVSGSGSAPITPTPVTAPSAVQSPQIVHTNQYILPSPVQAPSAVQSPSVSGTGVASVSPSPIVAPTAVQAPSISGSGAAFITSSPIAAPSAVQTPSVSPTGSAPISPSPVAAASSVQAPLVSGSGAAPVTASPVATVSSIQATVLAPTGAAPVSPSPVQASSAVQAPSMSGSGVATISPSPITVASAVQTPSIATGEQFIEPSPVSASSAVQAPSLSGSGAATITPSPVSAISLVRIPALSGSGAATIASSPVAAVSAIQAPKISIIKFIAPSPVGVGSLVQSPVLVGSGSAPVSPSPVAAISALQTPLIVGTGVAAITLLPVAAISAIVAPIISVPPTYRYRYNVFTGNLDIIRA